MLYAGALVAMAVAGAAAFYYQNRERRMTQNLLGSLEETRRVVGSLTTLIHYPHEIKEFPDKYLEMIMTNYAHVSCKEHLHPGLSCSMYAFIKGKRQLKTGLRLSALFILLPGICQSFKKLVKEPSARWRLLKKYIRSTLYLAVFGALPAILFCIGGPHIKINRVVVTMTYLIGGIAGYLFEKPSRHVQLLSFMLPKAIDCLANLLESRRFYRRRDWHTHIISLFTWALIAIASILESKK